MVFMGALHRYWEVDPCSPPKQALMGTSVMLLMGITITQRRYWEVDPCAPPKQAPRAYRIELVGVTCDPGLAVARGVWRKLRSGRSVPIPSQLRSHRLFSENWEGLAHAVDSAKLYHTGARLIWQPASSLGPVTCN